MGLWTNWRTLLRIAFARGYIWRGCELYLHCSNIKFGNAAKESDLICQSLPDWIQAIKLTIGQAAHLSGAFGNYRIRM